MEISGEPEPLLAAAIIAAIARLDEEAALAAGVPPARPEPGRWVTSGLPKTVTPPLVTRRPAMGRGLAAPDDPGPG